MKKEDVAAVENRLLLDSILSGQQSRVLKLGQQLHQSISGIVHLSRKIIHEDNLNINISIRDNDIKQYNDLMVSTLNRLGSNFQSNPSQIKQIKALLGANNELMSMLIFNDDSILNLRLQLLEDKEQLVGDIKGLHISVDNMLSLLKKLSFVTNATTNDLLKRTQNRARLVVFGVTIVSIMMLITMVYAVSLITLRIKKPLSTLSLAMGNLSAGNLSIRLKEKDFAKDEFEVLVSDFNRFASRNQELIEELSRTKDKIEINEKRILAILENAPVGVAYLEDDKIVTVNHKFEAIFGLAREQTEGESIGILSDNKEIFNKANKTSHELLLDDETYHERMELKGPVGDLFWCEVSRKFIEHNTSESTKSIWIFEDITQQKKHEKELHYLANNDSLTCLPNRTLFMDRLKSSLERAKRNNELIALLFVDIDHFKQINDSMGHNAGDMLLINIARRLEKCVRASDTVARLGGDEFIILLTEVNDGDDVAKIAEKAILTMAEPNSINNQEIIITSSIGISLYPNDGHETTILLQNADAAMYHAKSAGRDNYQFYTSTMNSKIVQRMEIEHKLRQAVKEEKFVLYYQPVIETHRQSIVGYEALIRWQMEEGELALPDTFMPILEETGLIISVGKWVFESGCKAIEKMLNGLTDKKLSINLSARQLQYKDLVGQVQNILSKTNFKAESLCLEITETILMSDIENNKKTLHQLHNLGIKIAIDDFGIGYSSLAYLKEFPIDMIKIDKIFVQNIEKNPSDTAICEAILAMARNLALHVVAKGVETEEQYNFLAQRGCQYVQGYLFGKPEAKPDVKIPLQMSDSA